MKLLSVNIGEPKVYLYKGKEETTSIFKSPVEGKVKVNRYNVEGDVQSDLNVHGGELKAVYSYDTSYYDHWKNVLQRDDWANGMFGENLTTQGLTDKDVTVGNIYKIGTAYIKAVQPRFPCFKLNIRFGIDDMLQQFMQHAMHGSYFKVEQEGMIEAGDDIVLAERSEYNVTIADYVRCYYTKGADKNILEELSAIEFIPQRHRKIFKEWLQSAD